MSYLLMQWQGPFEITHWVGPVNYEVYHPGHKWKKQIYYVNLLRTWKELEGRLIIPEREREELGPEFRSEGTKFAIEDEYKLKKV